MGQVYKREVVDLSQVPERLQRELRYLLDYKGMELLEIFKTSTKLLHWDAAQVDYIAYLDQEGLMIVIRAMQYNNYRTYKNFMHAGDILFFIEKNSPSILERAKE